MGLKLIIGPMKSGKSFELINYFAPLKYTDMQFKVYHPIRNIRDKIVWSRVGAEIEAEKIKNLSQIDKNMKIVGIDEVHMFESSDVKYIKRLLLSGVEVIVSGLDMDYRGEMFDIIRKLLELGPDDVIYKKAICDICKSRNAPYTQLLKNGKSIFEGVSSVVPDDGTYEYKAVCRKCFNKLK